MCVLSGSVIGDFHTSQIDLDHYDEKIKLCVVCVDVVCELTLFFVASSVDGMQSGQPAGSALGKHESHRKKSLFSSSNTKHYEQSVLPKQASVNCMCSSIWRISKHFPSRPQLNSRTHKHLYLPSCPEVVANVDRTGRTQQQHKQVIAIGT